MTKSSTALSASLRSSLVGVRTSVLGSLSSTSRGKSDSFASHLADSMNEREIFEVVFNYIENLG
jgi:hypothetical protein